MNERFEGIVLYARPHREHDALVKIFTDTYGMLMFYVKGAYRPNYPYRSQLIPATRNEYVGTIHHDGLSFIKEAKTIDIYRHIHEDFNKLAFCSYLMQLIDAAIEDHHEDSRLYHQTKHALNLIDTTEGYEVIVIYLELECLKYFGIDLNLSVCTICGTHQQPFDFSMKVPGVICQRHWALDSRRLHIAPRALYIASLLSQIHIEQIRTIQVSPETLRELRRLVDEIYQEFVGIRLKSKRYLDQIIRFEQTLQSDE